MNFENLDALRVYRDGLLQKSDAYFLPDYPLKGNFKDLEAAITVYRIELRDWPAKETDLSNATVPTDPTK